MFLIYQGRDLNALARASVAPDMGEKNETLTPRKGRRGEN